MEERCLSKELKGLRIPTYDEVRAAVLKAFQEPVPLARGVKRKGMVKHLLKIDRVYRVVDSKVFAPAEKLPNPDEVNEFYAEILAAGGVSDYKDLIWKLRGLRKAYRNLWREYRIRVKNTLNPKESNKVARAFVGRSLSMMRRLGTDLRKLSAVISELRKLPCIEFSQPKAVVAGMPQVGKSTFVRAVSTAEPEVSPFPFTTKEIILGHAYVDHQPIQVIDTPGILDRPFAELNEVERKALAAVRFLADILIYMVDPTPNTYYPLDQQLDLLRSLRSVFSGKEMIVVINKADAVNAEKVEEVEARIREVFGGEVFRISALKGVGLSDVMRRMRNLLGRS
ncbi:MAG: 50S ribosome-binding GTPase [Desulfurococcales archaeon]|nr:50S ribosome-binding GTPase [Desulfurococcales archaeon]